MAGFKALRLGEKRELGITGWEPVGQCDCARAVVGMRGTHAEAGGAMGSTVDCGGAVGRQSWCPGRGSASHDVAGAVMEK